MRDKLCTKGNYCTKRKKTCTVIIASWFNITHSLKTQKLDYLSIDQEPKHVLDASAYEPQKLYAVNESVNH